VLFIERYLLIMCVYSYMSNFPFDVEELREWAEENHFDVIDRRETEEKVICTYNDGREIHFHEDGMVVLQQHRALGGAEKDDSVSFNDSRLVVTKSTGETSRVSAREFPIDKL
jgi:maltodextrin utilization protein YvdJ